MVLVTDCPFFLFLILGNKGQENVFWHILEQKTPFWTMKTRSSNRRNITIFLKELCIGQIEASTCPPPGIPWAFDTFAVPGRREFDYQSLPGGGEFDPHALGVGNLNCTLDFM